MNLCGKYSLAQAAFSIAVADLIFSLGCILVHVLETTSTFECKVTWDPHNSTLVMSMLGIHPGEQLVYMKNAAAILCWVYFGIISANLILALVLWQAVLQESILKCVCYLLISVLLLLSGISVFLYHLIVIGKCPHYFALAMYPTYWLYKTYALLVVKCFLSQLRESPGYKRVRLRREYIQLEETQAHLGPRQDNRRSKFNDLIHLGTKSYQRYKSIIFDWRKPTSAWPEFEEAQYAIKEGLLKIDHGGLLECDEFTATLKGSLTLEDGMLIPIAVKTLKVTTPSIPHEKSLLDEVKCLIRIGTHENLQKFLGICRKTTAKDKLFIVYESYGLGKLDLFLSDIRDGLRPDFPFTSYVETGKMLICQENSGKDGEFNSYCMILWAYQVASGIEYLHNQQIVMGCISARNIILTNLPTVKICGIGLSNKLPHKSYKRDDFPSQFAWRWCSLENMECMENVVFSTRSDVWSYAVLLWEIFTLGEVPYKDWNYDIVEGLKKHWRLRRTDHIPLEIYDLMTACWTEDPKERPSFKLLVLFLKQFVSTHNLMHYK